MSDTETASVGFEYGLDGVGADSKLELRLWLGLITATKLISQEMRRRLRAEFGATLPQFDLLSQLYREPDGLRLGELSKRTMVTNGNVTGLVDRLENDGLVCRETPHDDRRVSVAKLTDAGRKLFGAMAIAHENWIRELLEDMDPAIVKAMVSHMGEVKKSVGRHMPDVI